jgi:DNA-directed RNA polymerase specialized sigma24 family protein
MAFSGRKIPSGYLPHRWESQMTAVRPDVRWSAAVGDALSGLSDRQAEIVRLTYFDRVSLAQVADHLRVDFATAAHQLALALRVVAMAIEGPSVTSELTGAA